MLRFRLCSLVSPEVACSAPIRVVGGGQHAVLLVPEEGGNKIVAVPLSEMAPAVDDSVMQRAIESIAVEVMTKGSDGGRYSCKFILDS